MRDLLFEIGTEEIPAGYLKDAMAQLERGFAKKAKELQLTHGQIRATGTPRRLALIAVDVCEKQPDIKEELIGPSKSAAIDANGDFTKAAQGFARSKGAAVEDLQMVNTAKGDYMMLVRETSGAQTISLLPDLLHSLLLEMHFPKSMKWASNKIAFARPIQWLVALFGEEVVPFSHEGIVTGNKSCGHRFHANAMFTVDNAKSYPDQLAEKGVLVDYELRRRKTVEEIVAAVADNKDLQDAKTMVDEDLVDTVTNLVEAPIGVCGSYDKKFLQLVPEVLITSMREHQKYFPVVDKTGELLPAFVAVNNTRVVDAELTRKGHQRVLRARLEDALFFYQSDRETPLEELVPRLDGIIFQSGLGTMLEKKDRLVKLCTVLAEKLEPELVNECRQAAELAKADLLTDMVGEFPSLQGVMGAAYAVHGGYSQSIAMGIREHYMPKRSGAATPETGVGAILALADRFDSLVGSFGLGQIPSGTADPFGLRRITLAILHIIEARGYRISLEETVAKALALYGDKVDGSMATVAKTIDFIKTRFAHDCVRNGYAAEAVAAATETGFDEVNDCLERIKAISALHDNEAFTILAASYKRVKNILKEHNETEFTADLFVDAAEKNLAANYSKVKKEMMALVGERQYQGALEAMLALKEPVDQFFDEVMVMAKDPEIRANRLALLKSLGDLILMVGDISKYQD